MPLEQWKAQAPWSLGVGWRLVQAYLRPGRDPGMQGAISTFLSSKEIPPRGEVGGRESARCLPPSVCPGLTQPPLLPLREGQIFNDCPPPLPSLLLTEGAASSRCLLPGHAMGVSASAEKEPGSPHFTPARSFLGLSLCAPQWFAGRHSRSPQPQVPHSWAFSGGWVPSEVPSPEE